MASQKPRSGPLSHVRVLEFEGIGPTPFAGMLLADLGADVIRIDRPTPSAPLGLGGEADLFGRGKRSLVVNLKDAAGVALAKRLLADVDVAIEGHRPGVMERLGLGPDAALQANPRLVYGRVTGYGQDGPLAQRAGHDANYLCLAGALGLLGTAERSLLPHNLVADFGGGGMLLVVGVLAALAGASHTGKGQVVDAAMVDGVALLSTMLFSLRNLGLLREQREANVFDGAAPFYSVYPTQDGGQYALAAVEPQFFTRFLEVAGVDQAGFGSVMDPSRWAAQKQTLAAVFAARTRAEWDSLLEGLDVCATPVLSLGEAEVHPHNVARSTFVTVHGSVQPAPAPRFSATPASIRCAAPARGADTDAIVAELATREAAATA